MKVGLRERVIKEAFSLLPNQGVLNLSLRDVARNLSVSHQAPYKHFESRDHLLAEMVARAYVELGRHIREREVQADPKSDLGAIGRAYLKFAQEEPSFFHLLSVFRHDELDRFPSLNLEVSTAHDELVRAIKNMTEVQDSDFVEECARFAWSAVHGMATLRLQHSMASSDESLLLFVCSAIEARAVARLAG